MINEICNILKIYKLTQITTVTDKEIIPLSEEQPLLLHPDNVTLESEPDKSDMGLSYKIEQTIPVSKLPKEKASLFPVPTPAIIEAETTSGNKLIIGTPDFPASVYIAPDIQKDQLSITCSILKTPF